MALLKEIMKRLALRALSHLETFIEQRPLPQSLVEFFRRQYMLAYLALVVMHTGLKVPFTLPADYRYTTTVNMDDSEDEQPFLGLQELLALLIAEQKRRKRVEEDEGVEDLQVTIVQVSIFDRDESHLAWHQQTTRFVAYDVRGNTLLGVQEKSNVSDEMLQGLGLPCLQTPVSSVRKG